MRICLRLGPAGSGKTFRCLAEIRNLLKAQPHGLPLLLLAPKQATYQLERLLLAGGDLAAYTRLRILSFERLAQWLLERKGAVPDQLDQEGRLMVLRGLLARRRQVLRIFRASARLTGFAQQLSLVLRELQARQVRPDSLRTVAHQLGSHPSLAAKLEDLALLLEDYLRWLEEHRLEDAEGLLAHATAEERKQSPAIETTNLSTTATARQTSGDPGSRGGRLQVFEQVWVDGFAEFSEQELELLAALLPQCGRATLALCVDKNISPAERSWLSGWSIVADTVERCRKKLSALPGVELETEQLVRREDQSRFTQSAVLRHLEQHWDSPRPLAPAEPDFPPHLIEESLRVAQCPNPEVEAREAAREILRHVRVGGRYREAAVLVRNLETYHAPVRRLFARYEIPFFLDRREPVTHHPLAELTRSALRTVAFDWLPDDWFAALKTGFLPASATEIDRLENEALARGWRGSTWQKPLLIAGQAELAAWALRLQKRLLPPFQRLALELGRCEGCPDGPALAAALRGLWRDLDVQTQLERWAAEEPRQPGEHAPNAIHATVWNQLVQWLENLELAFPTERLPLREWLPILETGLASLSVGVVPPTLDQVLVGAIDRSRNPDLKLAIVLGLNEGIFPERPQAPVLLSDSDRAELERCGLEVGGTTRRQIARERYFGYIACTRARCRLVLTSALRDGSGSPLNPSTFLGRLHQLFPCLREEIVPEYPDWRHAEHPVELIPESLRAARPNNGPASAGPAGSLWGQLAALPEIAARLEPLIHLRNPGRSDRLSPALAQQLYGSVLRTSVSRIEQFAACPFRFFVHSGLRAEERKRFEVDIREQGSFQHDALALFHKQLRDEGKLWRDLTPAAARERIAQIGASLSSSYGEGLFASNEQSRFTARVLTRSLQDFIEVLVGWMRSQYRFEPAAVELPFGDGPEAPPWRLILDGSHALELYGRIDRVDLCPDPQGGPTHCVVIDYKSSQKQLDPLLVSAGVQLQLLAYLNVLRHWPDPANPFEVAQLVPAGVFYVTLRGQYEVQSDRRAALEQAAEARRLAYRHAGCFDTRVLSLLDTRPGVKQGDQFNYRLNQDGKLNKNCRDPLPTAEFLALLDSVETNLKRMGQEIYSGAVDIAPYRKGGLVACDQCSYQAVCRFDPWSEAYRVLKK